MIKVLVMTMMMIETMISYRNSDDDNTAKDDNKW